MDYRIQSTLNYLSSLLNVKDDEFLISITDTQIKTTYLSDFGRVQTFTIDKQFNPIQKLLDHINMQMCTDCLQIEYLYKNEFFRDLVRSYIETLIHEFGCNVPITDTLAWAISSYELCDYEIQGQKGSYFLNI